MKRVFTLAIPTLLMAAFSNSASAAFMSCDSADGGTSRTWTFNSADACDTGPGNPNSSADIEALGGAFDLTAPDLWTKRGDVTDTGDVSAWLDVNLLTGTWGGKNITAEWSLAAGFWDAFGAGVFTVHVGGNPQQAPDDFGAFYITPGQYSGTWSFSQLPNTGGGGGLSNASIWTSGTPTITVSEPSILLLMGLSLLGVGLVNRRRAIW